MFSEFIVMTVLQFVRAAGPTCILGYLFWKYLNSEHQQRRFDQRIAMHKPLSKEEQEERLENYKKQLELLKLQSEIDYSLIWLKENFDKPKETSANDDKK